MVTSNVFDLTDFLGELPEAGFFSFEPQFAGGNRRSPNRQRFFQNAFQDFQNRFLGQIGRQARRGEVPDLKFTEFLTQEFDQFGKEGISNFERRFRSQSPSQRGNFSQFLNPRTRFLVNF